MFCNNCFYSVKRGVDGGIGGDTCPTDVLFDRPNIPGINVEFTASVAAYLNLHSRATTFTSIDVRRETCSVLHAEIPPNLVRTRTKHGVYAYKWVYTPV